MRNHTPITVLLAAASQILAARTFDEGSYRDEVAEKNWWRPPPRRRSRLVAITEEEFFELDIPERCRRDNWLDISFCERTLIDRRCLKRYRRKAGLR